jgi:tetratricopeptide (TPR) repeat protein
MTHKTKDAESVETMINTLPDNPDSSVMEKNLMLTTNPHNGKDFFEDLQNAITEQDIIELRAQLQGVFSSVQAGNDNRETVFELADTIDIPQFLKEWKEKDVSSLLSGKPLPKIHIHQHHRASTENIHPFYVDQVNAERVNPEYDLEAEDNTEFPFLDEALKESDIMDLRDTLRQISRSSSFQNHSSEDIENFIDGSMTSAELEIFETELELNTVLKSDIELSSELREAITESDIMALRGKLQSVMQSQHSTSRSLENVDAFLEGEMSENELVAFLDEMDLNNDLKAEVNLIKNLNKTFEEKDVHKLRSKLGKIAREINQQSIKSFLIVPESFRKVKRNGTYAAIFLVLVSLASLIWSNNEPGKTSYEIFFKEPLAVSSFRSIDKVTDQDLFKGLELYNQKDYISALACFNSILQSGGGKPIVYYYTGLTNQHLQQYTDALYHYRTVIAHQNNLYLEQAEWFMVFCTLNTSGNKSARKLLEAVINRKGFYYKDALALRSRLKKDD